MIDQLQETGGSEQIKPQTTAEVKKPSDSLQKLKAAAVALRQYPIDALRAFGLAPTAAERAAAEAQKVTNKLAAEVLNRLHASTEMTVSLVDSSTDSYEIRGERKLTQAMRDVGDEDNISFVVRYPGKIPGYHTDEEKIQILRKGGTCSSVTLRSEGQPSADGVPSTEIKLTNEGVWDSRNKWTVDRAETGVTRLEEVGIARYDTGNDLVGGSFREIERVSQETFKPIQKAGTVSEAAVLTRGILAKI